MDEELFELLAAPIDPEDIKTREQGGATIRYIDARVVIERLNSVCPGQWHFETELIAMPSDSNAKWVFKGRLTVMGCTQEDVGMNDNEKFFDPPKSAVSDALKRCAVHFGIGIELYGDAPNQTRRAQPTRAPQQNAKQSTPKPPQAQTPAKQEGTVTHIPGSARLCDLDGAQLYAIQKGGPDKFGIHPKHFENRWKKRYNVRAMKDITVTLDEFMVRMAEEDPLDAAFPRDEHGNPVEDVA
jgi:hypothetical protein